MKNLIIIGVFLSQISIQPYAHSETMETCLHAAEQLRKYLPARKDRYTTTKSAGCIPGNPKNKFIYILEINGLPQEILKMVDPNKDIKPIALNQFCSDPELRILISAFDIDHRYYLENGIFFGSFTMKENECHKIR